MNPDALIESYVGDVVRHLPRSQRNDVAFELRSLLTEELEGRAADAGRDADAAMALDLLAAFGRPADVADRYRPAGFTVIRPSEAPRFAQLALGGVAVQWALSLIAYFSQSGEDFLTTLAAWWLSWGLGSFWFPGFLVTFGIIAGYVTSRRQEAGEWMPARVVIRDRDLVRRPLLTLYIVLGIVGASLVIALPSIATWGSWMPAPVIAAFAFDLDFLAWRAPWVLLLWAATLAVGISLLVTGRWNRLARRLSLGINVAWLALLVWWIAAGRVFESDYANDVTMLCLVLVAIIVVFDLALEVRRSRAAVIHSPVT